MASDRQLSLLTNGGSLKCRRAFSARLYWDSDLPPNLVEKIWDDPDSLLLGPTLQDKQRCSVTRVNDPAGSFVWKRHNWGSPFRRVRRALSQTPAYKCWLDGRFLGEAGVPTPRPRAFLERRVGPFKIESYLLTDYVPGTSLYRLMRFGNPSGQMIRDVVRQVAALWQQLDELQVQHNDFKTENLIVDPQGKVWLIDLERMCRYSAGRRAERKHVRELEDLLHPRNWRANPAAGELLRQEILKTTSGRNIVGEAKCDNHPLVRPIASPTSEEQLVSVVIPCRNSAATIIPCLRSVFDMADEIIVADAGSTDNTLDLVREFGGCAIIEGTQREAAAFAAWAHNHAAHRWVLHLLPDEQLSPELARGVQDTLATEPKVDAFEVNYSHCFRGRRLAYGGFRHKPVVRLFRKGAARCETREREVEIRIESRRVGRIAYAIEREMCHDVGLHLANSIRNARSIERSPQVASRSLPHGKIVLDTIGKFAKRVVLGFGWLDGWQGIHAQLIRSIDEYIGEVSPWEPGRLTDSVAPRSNAAAERLRLYNPGHVLTADTSCPNVVRAEFEELSQSRAAA